MHLHLIIIVGAVLLRGMLIAASLLAEETIQIALYPKNLMALYFGLAQTAFLIGDTFGGVFGGWIYSTRGMTMALLVSAALTFANSIIFPLFASTIGRKNAQNPLIEAD